MSDTGQGIERKFLPFVFDRFRQAKRSNKIHAAGLGLGLAIVREIVDLHGGSVEVLSEGIDKGTTFIVRLPPTRSSSRSCRTRNSLACTLGEISLISSNKIVPP